MSTTFLYPEVARDESLVEDIFNKKVADPYRFLEDPHSESTKKFVSQQNEVTIPYLNKCPFRSKIKETLTVNQNYKKLGSPFKRGQKYYYFMNEGLQPQSVLYQQDSIDGEPRVFFDPNTLSDDGTVALTLASFSEDGQYFAYGLSRSGSDWMEISIKNVTTGEDLPEKLTRTKFTDASWTHDNKGFFYCQYPLHQGVTEGTDTNLVDNQSLYYHTLNTPQSEDKLKVDFPDNPKWLINCDVSDDGKYLFVYPCEGCDKSLWFYCDLNELKQSEKFTLKPIYDKKFEANFDYVCSIGDDLFFRTNMDAKNYRLVKLDLKNPSKENWVDILPNHSEDVLNWVEFYSVDNQSYFLVCYLRKVVDYLELRNIDGELIRKFSVPLGTIAKNSSRHNDCEFFFQSTNFLTPGQIFYFNLHDLSSELRLLRQAEPKNFDPNDFRIEQVFYASKDGTQVPMFLVGRKDLVKDGKNPCILYGYGGFNIKLQPSFNINRLYWLKNFNGILAYANLRGGGELGKKWHEGGSKLNKQNCFNDFIAAAEYLIEEKYTCTEKLAIEGGSNGGLLVAATSNQRPDLFGATLCHVGVLDMIRFASFTIGHAWMSDYGDPKEQEHFENLIKYSPYHNIPEAERYPATLLLTADHDDRVVPGHSLKFIAQLQYKLGKKLPNTPLLIRVDTKAGHGGGRPITKVIDENADVYSFLYNALKLEKYYKEE